MTGLTRYIIVSGSEKLCVLFLLSFLKKRGLSNSRGAGAVGSHEHSVWKFREEIEKSTTGAKAPRLQIAHTAKQARARRSCLRNLRVHLEVRVHMECGDLSPLSFGAGTIGDKSDKSPHS